MKNRTGRKMIPVLIAGALAVLALDSLPALAENSRDTGNTFVKQYTFTASDSGERHDEEFEPEVSINGKTYELKKLEYTVQEKTPKKVQKEVEKTVESDYIADGTEYVPQQEITEDGIVYKLDRMEALDEAEQTVSGYTDYSHEVTESSVPQTKEVAAVNTVSGQAESVLCSLTGVRRLGGEWVDSYIDITFISYDAEIFEWNGIEVAKNESAPLQGYEAQLLASVGADPGECRVRGISWNGGAYTDSSGTLCRNARADVQRYVGYYRAEYSGIMHAGTKYQAVYKGMETADSENEFDYQILASGTYQAEKTGITPYIAAGVGILLAAGLIVAVLFLLRGKGKKKKE